MPRHMEPSRSKEYNVFISHATEDKDDLARPLAKALSADGLIIWYDEFELHIGDSLRQRIDYGLGHSRFGVVVISPAFFQKNWTQYELDGLTAIQMTGERVILPVWHQITRREILEQSPPLADIYASDSSTQSVERIAAEIAAKVKDNESSRSPEKIAAVGCGNPPRWAIDTLRSLSCNAVITTTRQWREHPHRFREFGPQRRAPSYEESRAFALGRSHLPEDYVDGIDSYGSLRWVFEGFEKLASDCAQMFRTVGSGLAEHGSLIRAMTRLERVVESEKIVWDEFRKRTGHPNSPLPLEAGYNLLAIAELTVRLVDVIDSDNLDGDPEYEAHRRFAPEVIRRSDQWGEWRR